VNKTFYLTLVFTLSCVFNQVRASETQDLCDKSEQQPLVIYSKALRLKGQKKLLAICNLAYLGDHRAQYKLAKYYSQQEGKIATQESYIWAFISNSWYQQRRKEVLILRMEKRLGEKLARLYQDQANARLENIGIITEIDRLPKNRRIKKHKPLGSNIARTEEYLKKHKIKY